MDPTLRTRAPEVAPAPPDRAVREGREGVPGLLVRTASEWSRLEAARGGGPSRHEEVDPNEEAASGKGFHYGSRRVPPATGAARA